MAVKILKEDKKPSEIPSIGLEVEKFSLVINKKQLDQIGITVPAELINLASDVIE